MARSAREVSLGILFRMLIGWELIVWSHEWRGKVVWHHIGPSEDYFLSYLDLVKVMFYHSFT